MNINNTIIRIACSIIFAFLYQTSQATTTDSIYHIMTSDSVLLYVHVKGKGPFCLYLHGGPGAGSTWMQIVAGQTLEKHYTMVYLDQRGVCKSETPRKEDFSFSRQISDWEEVRKSLHINHWLLMGHSWGGILEMGYWEKHRQHIDGMIFINCTLSCQASFLESWLPKAISIVGDKVNPKALDESLTIKERMMAIFPQLNNDNRWEIFTPNKWANDSLSSWSFHKHCLSHGKGEEVLWINDYWHDFRPLTREVQVPVLVIFGKYDYAVGPKMHKSLHFPNVIIRGIDCGHMPFLEKPEAFAKAIDDYAKYYKRTKNQNNEHTT